MYLRKIIHIDMDAFFASVEQRDNPQLRGKAIAVGGGEVRGVVCAASYEARKWGVRSAMPGSKAKSLCPHLIFVRPRFDAYKAVSEAIHSIFHDYTDLIEPLSLDEAFLDVTENKQGISLAQDIAKQIKERIYNELGLTASAGVSYNKFLAKIASDYDKPNGMCVIHPSRAEEFISQLKIEDFWGVGRVTTEYMHTLGIYTGADLRAWSVEQLTKHFGKMGHIYYDFARGIDLRPVESEWQRKSVGCEYTLDRDTSDYAEMKAIISELAIDLERRAIKAHFIGRSLILKIKYHNFKSITRSHTPPSPPRSAQEFREIATYLLEQVYNPEQAIRLLGLSLSNPLSEQDGEIWYQPTLFTQWEHDVE